MNKPSTMHDDAGLLRAYAGEHSEAAFAELVERRVGFVHGTALRQVAGQAHLAQDVTQAVFSLVAKKAAELARHECLAGWLHATTTHVARRVWRDACVRKKYETEFEKEAALMNDIQVNGATGAASEAEFAQVRPLLDEALGALGEGERNAVLLRFFEGCAFAEVGARLRISEEAARKRVARAVEAMRDLLARRGVKSSAAALGALMSAEAAQAAPAGLAVAVSSGAVVSSAAVAATAGLAGAGGLLAVLSSAKVVTVAAVALLFSAGAVFYGSQSERDAQAALDAAKRENALLSLRLRAAGQRREAGAAGAREQVAPQRTVITQAEIWAAYPKVKEAYLAAATASMAGRYYRMRLELGLSDEQWEQFLRIRTNMAGRFPPKEERSRSDPSHYSGMKIETNEPILDGNAQLRALLGDAGYACFDEESKSMTAASSDLADVLWFTETPLTAEQARKYEELVAGEYRAWSSAGKPWDYNAVWDSIVEKSGAVLSEPQKQALADHKAATRWRLERQEFMKPVTHVTRRKQ